MTRCHDDISGSDDTPKSVLLSTPESGLLNTPESFFTLNTPESGGSKQPR